MNDHELGLDPDRCASPLPATLMQRPALALSLAADNARLPPEALGDAALFADWLATELARNRCDYALGGYGEDRAIYAASPLFASDDDGPARSIHLGVDIWMAAGTPVFAIADGRVHSLADNSGFGNYGGTVLVDHGAHGGDCVSLYGHLAPASIGALTEGEELAAGAPIGTLGTPAENGGWTPHLHLQLIRDPGDWRGDFPGVCTRSHAERYLRRCPDPEPLLQRWCGPRIDAAADEAAGA